MSSGEHEGTDQIAMPRFRSECFAVVFFAAAVLCLSAQQGYQRVTWDMQKAGGPVIQITLSDDLLCPVHRVLCDERVLG